MLRAVWKMNAGNASSFSILSSRSASSTRLNVSWATSSAAERSRRRRAAKMHSLFQKRSFSSIARSVAPPPAGSETAPDLPTIVYLVDYGAHCNAPPISGTYLTEGRTTMRGGIHWWICVIAMFIAATALAADYFAYADDVYNVAPPPETQPPASGTALRAYIYDRQMDSFKADNAFMIRRFIEWMPLPIDSKPGITGLQVRSHRQFKRHIKPGLESGKPVLIALLKADANDLFNAGQANAVVKNHQVLAIGFSLHDIRGDDEWDIHIYDPNFTGDVQTLHTRKPRQTSKSNFNVVTGHFRAFFILPYSHK